MVMRRIDTFEKYSAAADFDSRWIRRGNDPLIVTGVALRGNNVLEMVGASRLVHNLSATITSPPTIFVSFWAKFRKTLGSQEAIIRFGNVNVEEVNSFVRITATGTIKIENALSQSMNEGTNTISLNTWQLWEVRATHLNALTSTDFYEVIIDGVSMAKATSGDTAIVDEAIHDFVLQGAGDTGSATSTYFDSVIAWDTTGSSPWNASYCTDATKKWWADCLSPNGNGNTNQFTGSDGNSTDNYLLVDDGVSDGDTTYVESSTVTDADLYAFENLNTDLVNNVLVVQHGKIWKRSDSGAKTAKHRARISSTNYDGSAVTPGTGYTFSDRIMENSPATSSPWTSSEVNAAEFGSVINS